MRRSLRLPPYVLLVLALTTSRAALAAPDELIPCNVLTIKVDSRDPTLGHVKLLCKAPVPFAVPIGNNSPIMNGMGATLIMRDLTSMAVIVPGIFLPSERSGWRWARRSGSTVIATATPRQVELRASR